MSAMSRSQAATAMIGTDDFTTDDRDSTRRATMRSRPPRTRPQRDGHRQARTIRRDVGVEIARLREGAGLSLRRVAEAAGIAPSTLASIEAGSHSPTIEVLARVGATLGGSLAVRFYPGTGPRIRDHLQASMLQALVADLHPRWRRRPEVAVYRPVRGVIDMVLETIGGVDVVSCEAQSQLRRLEQQVRWATMKADALEELMATQIRGRHARPEGQSPASPPTGPPHSRVSVSRLLLLRSTRANRQVVSEFGDLLATAYPARHEDVIAALTSDAPWPGHGLVWCSVEGGRAWLHERPPRGIKVGRQ